MISSMTGFGRSEIQENDKKVTVEMKSVNHRYLDVNIKLPKKFNFYEAMLRNLLRNYVERGKLDIFITYEDLSQDTTQLNYNGALAKEYLTYIHQMGRELMLENDITTSTLMRCPEIFTMQEKSVDEEAMERLLSKALSEAAEGLAATRQREGEHLKQDLLAKLDKMMEYVLFIEERAPQITQEYRQKITEKVNELLENTQIDENRIVMEVTLFADKVCVDEELVRLKSHVAGMKETLLKGGAVGRKLDFVTQEMNREANTILSKSTDLTITDVGIELKTMIEKLREQIQNIE